MIELPLGTRVIHLRTGEHATVVERQACAADCTTVQYDSDDGLWNTPTIKLQPLPDDET